jgi:hypothetical protein
MEPTTETNPGRIPNDAYYTPDALASACMSWLVRDGFYRGGSVMEPSAGKGAFVRAAIAAGAYVVHAVDIDNKHEGEEHYGKAIFSHDDFLRLYGDHEKEFDLVIGNPPFSAAEAHVRKALTFRNPWGSVAFLLRLAFLESVERVPFWKEHPASKVYVFSQRPSFTGGKTDTAAYGLFVWQRGWTRPTELEVCSWR